MRRPTWIGTAIALVAVSLVAAGCGDDDDGDDGVGSDTTEAASGDLDRVALQLQWFTQSQFAGYFAADELGFYEDQGIDIEILEGGVDIVPQTVLAQGEADFAVAWVPKALASREQGAEITNVAQIFQRSGTLQVALPSLASIPPKSSPGSRSGTGGSATSSSSSLA